MNLFRLFVLLYTLGVLPSAYAFIWKIQREISQGVTPDIFSFWPTRNVMLIAFAVGLCWPLLLVCYLVVRLVIKPFWSNDPPDDGPDLPQEGGT